jgi:hypothetical protein
MCPYLASEDESQRRRIPDPGLAAGRAAVEAAVGGSAVPDGGKSEEGKGKSVRMKTKMRIKKMVTLTTMMTVMMTMTTAMITTTTTATADNLEGMLAVLA